MVRIQVRAWLYNILHSDIYLTLHIQDNSDVQYRSFRSNIPALLAFAAAFFGLKQLYLRFSRSIPHNGNSHLLPFYLSFSLVMLVALHGTSALKVLLILSGNFAIARLGKGAKWTPLATWVYNMAVLFANERFEGYHYAALHQELGFLVCLRSRRVEVTH